MAETMLLLDAETLATLAALAVSAMPNTATIIRPRIIDDGAGGTMPDPAGPLTFTTVCSFTPIGALGRGSWRDLLAEHGRYLMTVPLAGDIQATDLVDLLGQRYTITWAPPPDAFSVERMATLTEAL